MTKSRYIKAAVQKNSVYDHDEVLKALSATGYPYQTEDGPGFLMASISVEAPCRAQQDAACALISDILAELAPKSAFTPAFPVCSSRIRYLQTPKATRWRRNRRWFLLSDCAVCWKTFIFWSAPHRICTLDQAHTGWRRQQPMFCTLPSERYTGKWKTSR